MKKHLDKLLKFQNERDWKQYHTPKNLAISLSLEASEILELFQWTDDNKLPEKRRMPFLMSLRMFILTCCY